MRRLSFLVVLAAGLAFVLSLSIAGAEPRARPVSPLISLTPLAPAAPGETPRKIHPALLKELLTAPADRSIRAIVVVHTQDDGLDALTLPPLTSRAERRAAVVHQLQTHAAKSQAGLRRALAGAQAAGEVGDVRPFWITNAIALRGRPDFLLALAARPDVATIRKDDVFTLDPMIVEDLGHPPAGWASNLVQVNLPLAATALDLDGRGVVVASLDTGVDWQHPQLVRSYRGYAGKGLAQHRGNWHVSTDESNNYPVDLNGHGTHTLATIVGDDGQGDRVGVAPGAKWIAVKVFNTLGLTHESWIHDAFEWVLAPEGDPTLAPDIVSNSWGSRNGGLEVFRPDVAALRAAGILPVFAAGNNGPDSETVNSPGSYPEALAVGAVDEENRIATFSSRGPSRWDEIKPEVVAPGVKVRSAYPGGGYAWGTGTSMAVPHVAGAAALLLQADPSLSPDAIEAILTRTARPLGTAPNNTTGWGLLDVYVAALGVTESGGLRGQVIAAGGAPVPTPTIEIEERGASIQLTVTGDVDGLFAVALRPGRYDLEATAFGYERAKAVGVTVREGAQTDVVLTATRQPLGLVFGRVTDARTGGAVRATVEVPQTPARTQSDAATGEFRLALPPGDWPLLVRAGRHRLGRGHVSLGPDDAIQRDFALSSAPHILLVDGGRWYYESHSRAYEQALTELDYPYDLHRIRAPFETPSDIPTATHLLQYDLVIWSAPDDSPGFVGASEAISTFLHAGGRLLLSGQDVAFWDGGGNPLGPPAPYFKALTVGFLEDREPAPLVPVAGGPLAGLDLQFNTSDSARNQFNPDALRIQTPEHVAPLALWSDGSPVATGTGLCRRYRVALLGFGLEGVGPQSARVAGLGRLLEWLDEPAAPYGVQLAAQSTVPAVGRPGSVVTHALTLRNNGTTTDTFTLDLSGADWITTLSLPEGAPATGARLTLAPCTSVALEIGVAVPQSAGWQTGDVVTLTAVSHSVPTLTAAVSVTSKTPAPVLFVNDERFYHHAEDFQAAFRGLALPVDTWESAGDHTPGLATLSMYPLVIWTTGYDWVAPLTAGDEAALGRYLTRGGRLALFSPDLLYPRGLTDFARDYLGVRRHWEALTTTMMLAAPESPLGSDLGPWSLDFPFLNWSDGLEPAPGTQTAFTGEHRRAVALLRERNLYRAAFFAVPFEALPPRARNELLPPLLRWLSPLNPSRLERPVRAVRSGAELPITLTIGYDLPTTRPLIHAWLDLPPELALVPNSLAGGALYDPDQRRITWAGRIPFDDGHQVRARLRVAEGVAPGTTVPLRAHVDDGTHLVVTLEAPLRVDSPDLADAAKDASPGETSPGQSVTFAISATNRGVVPGAARLTDTLPVGLALVPSSINASTGALTVTPPSTLVWQGALAPGETLRLTYSAGVTLTRPGARLTNLAHLDDGLGEQYDLSAEVVVPARLWLPLLLRSTETPPVYVVPDRR